MFLKKLLNFIMELLLKLTKNRDKIDLSDYPVRTIDPGTLTLDQELAMRGILAAAALGHENALIPELTQDQFDEVVTHIGLHFGNADLCKNIALKRGSIAKVNLDIYKEAIVHKAELDRRVEEALSTLYEGTIENKLMQVSKYIANRVKYKAGSNNPLDLLDEGGMCCAYSMLFYKMATRLGAEAYICYGYASNGIYSGAHAWNMVKLGEKYYFYDITFYDSGRNKKYIHSDTTWERSYRLNDQSGMRKA